jgi:two-component system sensor histidine kinase MprB
VTFRTRLTLAAAAAVAIAVALASVAAFLLVRSQLRRQVDLTLEERSQTDIEYLRSRTFTNPSFPRPRLGGPGGYAQIVTTGDDVLVEQGERVEIPVTSAARLVAAGRTAAFFQTVQVGGTDVRVLTTPLAPGFALQVARPLDEVRGVLRRLGAMLFGVSLGGVALAVVLGRAVARTALTPVQRLTEAAERVAETRDLAHRIESGGGGELGSLATSFNSMLEALDESLRAQRQLVADASHELRTPLTSLRTNIEVLARAQDLPAEERAQILSDVTLQLDELTGLLGDLIELARGVEPAFQREDVRLDLLAAETTERVAIRFPGLHFTTDLEPAFVVGTPERLHRAIGNLLDNASKWSPPGGEVEVRVSGSELSGASGAPAAAAVSVRDHGPGIAPEDLPHVFDRFYRSPAARGTPGSGLGLAIVQQIAESHGGCVVVENAQGGGARFTLRLPPAPPHEGIEGGDEAAAVAVQSLGGGSTGA